MRNMNEKLVLVTIACSYCGREYSQFSEITHQYHGFTVTTCMPARQPLHSCCHHMHASQPATPLLLSPHACQRGGNTSLAATTCMPARQPHHSCCHHMHACQPGSHTTLAATT